MIKLLGVGVKCGLVEWVDFFSFQIYKMVVHSNHDIIDTVS